MDQELREYLDKQFKSIDELFSQSAEELQEFRQETNKRFERVDKRFEGIEQRLEGVETGVRHNGVLIESLEDKVQLVAESVANVASDLKGFKGEMAQEIKDVRATMELHDSELDRRLKKLRNPAALHRPRPGSGPRRKPPAADKYA